MHFFELTSSVKDLGQQRTGWIHWTVKFVFGLRREECSICATCYLMSSFQLRLKCLFVRAMLWLPYCIYTSLAVLVPECTFVSCKAFVLCAQGPALCKVSFYSLF